MGVTKITNWNGKTDYPKLCLNYIHLNPIHTGLVMKIEDWDWSSYHEIYGKSTDIELVNNEKLRRGCLKSLSSLFFFRCHTATEFYAPRAYALPLAGARAAKNKVACAATVFIFRVILLYIIDC